MKFPDTAEDEIIELLRAIETPGARGLETFGFESADIMLPWQLSGFEHIG